MPENKRVGNEEAQRFPKAPTPATSTPQEGEPAQGGYFVVLHDGVGDHRRDAVVSGEALGNAEAIERLLRLGAVRPLS